MKRKLERKRNIKKTCNEKNYHNIGALKEIGIVSASVLIAVLFLIGVCAAAIGGSTSNTSSATNLMVDLTSTTVSNTLHPGYSALLQVVLKNTGGRDAEDVTFYLYDNLYIKANTIVDLSDIGNGESKTISKVIRVDENAVPGLYILSASAIFDSFDSSGIRTNNDKKYWEIPIRIYADPMFQVKPEKTEYSKDTIDTLKLICLGKDDISDLTATLSSSCITVIGSSNRYIGDIKSDEDFYVEYEIKPGEEGACSASLSLSYLDGGGTRVSDNISFGINIKGAGVDFKVINISYAPTSPGDTRSIKITLKNVGKSDVEDTTLLLSLSDPFVPVDTTERYIGKISGEQTFEVEFNLAVSWDAETKVYSVPLTITYKVGGTSYSVEKDIGIGVSGKIVLEVITVTSSRGTISIEVANIGTRTADAVKATLTFSDSTLETQQQQNFSQNQSDRRARFSGNRTELGNLSQFTATQTQSLVSYKSDIKPNKQTTFTFSGQGSGQALLTLEYTGANNERVRQTERITLPRSVASTGIASTRGGGTDITQLALYAAIILIVLFIVYKFYKRRKKK